MENGSAGERERVGGGGVCCLTVYWCSAIIEDVSEYNYVIVIVSWNSFGIKC